MPARKAATSASPLADLVSGSPTNTSRMNGTSSASLRGSALPHVAELVEDLTEARARDDRSDARASP